MKTMKKLGNYMPLAARYVWLAAAALVCWPGHAHCQRHLEEAIPYRKQAMLRQEGGLVEVEYTRKAYEGIAADHHVYHCYYRDSIYRVRGGYHGHPLHGRYVERYADKTVKVMGRYRYGLKTGRWQYWDADGELRKRSNWREGVETGPFSVFGPEGQLQQTGYLRDGKMEGIAKIRHAGDSVGLVKKRYRNGGEIAMDAGSWFSRMLDRARLLFR